jgi:1-acyl-sn-glycerol-3-phosphate acyltransferase
MEISKDRLTVLSKIEKYERLGLFDQDVEDDPPTAPLDASKVDYVGRKLSTRIATKIANGFGKRHFEGMLRRREVIIKEVRGTENLDAVRDVGAIVTCNHFNAFDNYAVYKSLKPILKKRNLYKIIREGNYTSFGGFYGYLFRHCNTLPLCSSLSGMKALMNATKVLLNRGEKILIYPEQGMWYNYRKPRPLKMGAFRFAARDGAPVLPIFITLEDTDRYDSDGLPIQAYTVHVLPPIFPDKDLSVRENTERMCLENYKVWVDTYEKFYGIKLQYTTEGGEVNPCSI